jgi:methylenetetrahydrofolate--tRNA-(uracil-5-)-methyltransferase
LRREPRIRLAGQLTGVEGYLESAATGLAVALYLVLERRGDRFQPANITFALLPPLEPAERRRLRQKRARHERQVEIGLEAFGRWLDAYAAATARARS